VIPQAGDGNCLFHSIGWSCGRTAEDLRSSIADWVHEHSTDVYIPGSTIADLVRWETDVGVEHYAERMKRSGVWGGVVELVAASHLLQTDIHVVVPDGDGGFVRWAVLSGGDKGKKDGGGGSVYVAYDKSCHYDAFRPG
jgi:hypothetical protein